MEADKEGRETVMWKSQEEKRLGEWINESIIVTEEPGRQGQDERGGWTEAAGLGRCPHLRHAGYICAPSNSYAPETSQSRLTCL